MNPYLAVLRRNRNFRMLYIGQTVSQLGDWFNTVAVSALLLDLTGSATAVAWMMIVQFLPIAVVSPVAGVVVDRVDRRRLMIAADLIRGCLILGLLLVREAHHVWIAYTVIAFTVSATAFFEPSRNASIPAMTAPEELMPANALSSATWSAMLAVGASLGGLVSAVFGQQAAFVVNAASFFTSAFFIAQTSYRSSPPPAPPLRGWLALTGVPDLVDGFRYVQARSRLAALLFVKAGWGLAGGVLLLLTVYGQRVFPVAGSTAAGIGVLYGARGVGAALGPIMLRWLVGQEPHQLRRAIGPAYFIVGGFYVALAFAPNLPVAALFVLCAHFGGAILWVFSTVLLQIETPDRFRGRVFAAELALVQLTSSASSYWTGLALDRAGWSPQRMAFVLGALFCAPGLIWLALERRWRRPAASSPAPSSMAASSAATSSMASRAAVPPGSEGSAGDGAAG